MAVTRTTQKDVGNYEAKLIGPLTTRQTAIMGATLVPVVILDLALKGAGIDPYTLFGITFVLMAPSVFFAFGQKFTYGMRPEEFLKEYWFYHILAPKVRKYQTETLDDIIELEKVKKEDNNGAKKSKKKKKKSKKELNDEKLKNVRAGHYVTFDHKENSKIPSFE